MRLDLSLPYPPAWTTGNHAVRHFRSGGKVIHALSPEAKTYRDEIIWAVKQQRGVAKLRGPLLVVLRLRPPDLRERDAGNVTKTLYDNLTHAGLWVDDSNKVIRAEVIEWADPIKGGLVQMTILAAWTDSISDVLLGEHHDESKPAV